jgi:hypothetical protein
VVNLGAFPQPCAGFAATSRLQAPQGPGLVTWRIPELPCDHASAVPDRILVGTGVRIRRVPFSPDRVKAALS